MSVTSEGRVYFNATLKMTAFKVYATKLAERGDVGTLNVIKEFIKQTIDQHGRALDYIEVCINHANKQQTNK